MHTMTSSPDCSPAPAPAPMPMDGPGYLFSASSCEVLRAIYTAKRAACAFRLAGRIQEAETKESIVTALLRTARALCILEGAESMEQAAGEGATWEAAWLGARGLAASPADRFECEGNDCGVEIGVPGSVWMIGQLSGRNLCGPCGAIEKAGRKA